MLSQLNRSSAIPQHYLVIIGFNIDCEDIFLNINTDYNNFSSHYQKVIILQDLQTDFELLYIGCKRNDHRWFFLSDKHKGQQNIYASKFDDLLFKMLSEESINNKKTDKRKKLGKYIIFNIRIFDSGSYWKKFAPMTSSP